MTNSDPIPPLQKAALALRAMRAQLDAAQRANSEPIAIVGMACRFPGSGTGTGSSSNSGLDSFWDDLRAGRDCIQEVPADRWSLADHYDRDPSIPGKMYTRSGGFIPNIDRFDAAFFGIHPHEAERMDPQQRLVLELTWEALEHAGIAPDRLAGSKTGVFFGLMTVDYLRLLMGNGDLSAIDPFAALANGLSFPAGRLSYSLGLQGPSMVVATACSSSLVALHLACQALRNRECNLALAGGVNAILSPEMNVLLSKTQVLSPSGRCKSFDASADGYTRGEGCGALALMRLSDADKGRHPILALVRGSAVNHSGMSGALTVPSGQAQQALILDALGNAGLSPASVSYVEAHGTGTPLGDPIELRALDQVMRQGHTPSHPCAIGSVKTNIGHLEAAAGVASVIKTVLALDREEIPPSLHFHTPNPHLTWSELSLQVVDKLRPWPRSDRPRVAGVSSFGLSGINAHVVLEEAPHPEPAQPDDNASHVLTLSAKTESALRSMAERLETFLGKNPSLCVADVCYTLNGGRPAFPVRLAAVVSSIESARQRLSAFLTGTHDEATFAGHAARFQPKGGSSTAASSVNGSSLNGSSLTGSSLPGSSMSGATMHGSSPEPTPVRLCEAWVAGGFVDWQKLHAGSKHRLVSLPGYPFEGVRYWSVKGDMFAPTRAASHLEPESDALESAVAGYLYRMGWPSQGPAGLEPAASVLPSPASLFDSVHRAMPVLKARMQSELSLYRSLLPHLARLANASAVHIVRSMGWPMTPGDSVTVESLAARIECIAAYVPFLGRLLELLISAGYARRDADRIVVEQTPPAADIAWIAEDICRQFPDGRVEVELVARCARSAPAVLRGQQDPLELLFARDQSGSLEDLYVNSGAYRALNELIRELVQTVVTNLPEGRRLRVLEAGAGTGATSSVVLPLLPADRTEYVFTDISPAFTAAAATRFAHYPGFRTAIFDLEQSGPAQGLAPAAYDIVLAVNVLHATGDLRQSTAHLLQLLAPGGLLVIVEGISPQGWLDIMFGLLPGWWNFKDRALRPSHPLLSEEKWLALLSAEGCPDVCAIPGREKASSFDVEMQQSILLSRAPDAVSGKSGRYWLIFADDRVDIPVARALRAAGDTVIEVRPGPTFAQPTAQSYVLDPARREDFRRLLDATLHATPYNCAGIVYLWAMEEPPDEVSAFEEPWQRRICGGLLNLAAALVETPLTPAPQLSVVTARAVPAGDPGERISAHQATVWGLGRVIASERAELRCRLIDLDALSAGSDSIALLDELSLANTPDLVQPQVAIRNGTRRIAQIERCPEAFAGQVPLQLSAEATYVVIGASGGLGMLTAEWLVRRGSRHLALVARRMPAEETWTRLKQQGVSLRWFEADVSNIDAMRSCFEAIQSSGHPLKGVVHSAGVLRTGPLGDTGWDAFWPVLSAKVAGTAVLAELSRALELDFLILFSSAITLVSEPGTAAYCSTNTFLDSQAHALRHRGYPAQSIGWGEWRDVGMAKDVRTRRALRRAAGEAPTLSIEEGLYALEKIVATGTAQCAVLPIDLSAVRDAAIPASIRPLLAGLHRETAGPAYAAADLPSRLLALSAEEREAAVSRHLREVIAVTLGIPECDVAADASFADLNMDSLAVIEILNNLKQSLGVIIYPREVFEQGAVNRLAAHIAAEFERARGMRPDAHKPLSAALIEEALSSSAAGSPAAVEKRNPPAVFILSAPRSGSTLLRVMLAGHSQLFSPPELHLLPFASMDERSRKLGATYFGEGLQRALMELRGANAATVKQCIAEMEAAGESVQNVYALLQKEALPRMLVDKTPAYAASMDALLRAEGMFDGARYLCLVRHPLAVIESFVRMRFSHLVGAGDMDPYELAEEVWSRSYSNIREFCDRVGPERCCILRYEDLIGNPREEARRICHFLGIPFEEALLHPYEGARMNDGVHAGSAPLNDPNFMTHDQIDASLADRWRSVPIERRLSARTRRLAELFGYDLPAETQPLPHQSSTWTERIVQLRSGGHAVCSWGSGNSTPVVLIHGLLEHGAAWEQTAAFLADLGQRAIAPDLRGHGRSIHTPPGVLYHPLDFLGDLDELVSLEVSGPVDLVGHSMGAALAALYASARPEKIRSLVLVEPPAEITVRTDDPGERLAVQLNYLAKPSRQQIFRSIEDAATRLQQGFPSLPRGLAEAFAARITAPAENGGFEWRWDARLNARAGIGFGSFAGATPADLLRSLSKMPGPVTLVYGDSSSLMRPDDVELQTSALPTARKITLGGGHNLHYDAPRELAEIIAETVALARSAAVFAVAAQDGQ